jgi:hypothetical protein
VFFFASFAFFADNVFAVNIRLFSRLSLIGGNPDKLRFFMQVLAPDLSAAIYDYPVW